MHTINEWELTKEAIIEIVSGGRPFDTQRDLDMVIAKAAQRKLVEWIAEHTEKVGPHFIWFQIDNDTWQELRKGVGLE